jgi:hypothetical protein
VRGGPGQRRRLAAGWTTDVDVILHQTDSLLLGLTTTGAPV